MKGRRIYFFRGRRRGPFARVPRQTVTRDRRARMGARRRRRFPGAGGRSREVAMQFLYDNVRNTRHGIRSEKRQHGASTVFVLALVDMRNNAVLRETTFHDWNQYSQHYQQMLMMLQSVP
jgi:hypothetical protein